MKTRAAFLVCLTLALTVLPGTSAEAGRRYRSSQPAASSAPSTILPSSSELAAVPVPESGRVIEYPVDVVRYGLTVHPGARIVRGIFGR